MSDVKESIERSLLDMPEGRYNMVHLARAWMTVLLKRDEYRGWGHSDIVKKALEDILAGRVTKEEILHAYETERKAEPRPEEVKEAVTLPSIVEPEEEPVAEAGAGEEEEEEGLEGGHEEEEEDFDEDFEEEDEFEEEPVEDEAEEELEEEVEDFEEEADEEEAEEKKPKKPAAKKKKK